MPCASQQAQSRDGALARAGRTTSKLNPRALIDPERPASAGCDRQCFLAIGDSFSIRKLGKKSRALRARSGSQSHQVHSNRVVAIGSREFLRGMMSAELGTAFAATFQTGQRGAS